MIGDETAGGGELDPVGARAQGRAYDVPHLLGAVDEVRRLARDSPASASASRPAPREIAVAVAAGLADEDHGDLQRRPGHVAARDRVAHARVGAAEVADEGDARLRASLARSGAASSVQRVIGVAARPPGRRSRTATWSWQSKTPGISQRSEKSIDPSVRRVQVLADLRDAVVLDPDVERPDEAARSRRARWPLGGRTARRRSLRHLRGF